MSAQVDRLALLDLVETRLGELPETTPPTTGWIDKPVDVPTLTAEGHVQRYWVLHPFWGRPSDEHDLGEATRDLDWTFQVTVAAAFKRDCLALAYDVDALLHLWRPELPGHSTGALMPPDGYDPGPPREDSSLTPIRWYLPLQYRTRITRSA